MTYRRVMPRDLFNEGSLLTCLGKLWIRLDDRRDHNAYLGRDTDDDAPYTIRQNESDGSISADVTFLIGGDYARLYRPLNCRSYWPLYCEFNDEVVRVFEDCHTDAILTYEFQKLIGMR